MHSSQEGGEEQGQVAAAQEEVLEAVLQYDVLRKEMREKMRTERLMGYFKETRGWGEEADR